MTSAVCCYCHQQCTVIVNVTVGVVSFAVGVQMANVIVLLLLPSLWVMCKSYGFDVGHCAGPIGCMHSALTL